MKKGDIVYSRNDWMPSGIRGEVIAVVEDLNNSHPIFVNFDYEIFPFGVDPGKTWVTLDCVISEAVYNSKLYKVLE